MGAWLYLFAWACVASVGVGGYAARQKGRPIVEGMTLGLLLGPFGAMLAAMLPGRADAGPVEASGLDGDRVDVSAWDTGGPGLGIRP